MILIISKLKDECNAVEGCSGIARSRNKTVFYLEFKVKMACFGRLNIFQLATKTQNLKLCSNRDIKDEMTVLFRELVMSGKP